jgi:hypothetical protein
MSPLATEPALAGAVANNSGKSVSMIHPVLVRLFKTKHPSGTLNGRWVYLMRTWAEDVRGKADHPERDDIEAELQLRKVEPPFDLVKDAMAALRQKSKEAMAELERDLERLAREERNLGEKIESFEATTKGPTN